MRSWTILTVLVLTACMGAVAPPPPAPRDALSIEASFDETWNAAIDHFAESNIPISAIEKASGIVATALMAVPRDRAQEWADCGYDVAPFSAESVTYNVLVRGDTSRSTVRVTASWNTSEAQWACSTKGTWEADAEAAIKARAEGTPVPSSAPQRAAPLPLTAANITEIETRGQALPRPQIPIPSWARVIGSSKLARYYPLSGDCRAWHAIAELGDIAFYESAELAERSGLQRSGAQGCG